MNAHARFEELLPLYAAGQLSAPQRSELETHLAACPDCQSDLALWRAVSGEIGAGNQVRPAPPYLVERALDRIQSGPGLLVALRTIAQLLQTQALMIEREMWPACAVVMALGVVVCLLANHTGLIYFMAPLMAASSLAILFDPEHDPALELTLATPVSLWKILLARLSVISAYNLGLALAAGLALAVIVPPGLLGALILGWLGPMAFLSALALLLSLWVGASRATAVVYGLWLAQYIPYQLAGTWTGWEALLYGYQQFWRSPGLLLALALLLLLVTLRSAARPTFRLT